MRRPALSNLMSSVFIVCFRNQVAGGTFWGLKKSKSPNYFSEVFSFVFLFLFFFPPPFFFLIFHIFFSLSLFNKKPFCRKIPYKSGGRKGSLMVCSPRRGLFNMCLQSTWNLVPVLPGQACLSPDTAHREHVEVMGLSLPPHSLRPSPE